MKAILYLLIFSLAGAAVLQAQDRVVARTKRINLLKSAKQDTDVSNPELLAGLPDTRYPFEFKPEEAKVVAPTPQGPVTQQPVAEPEVTPEQVLEEFASRLRPTGVLSMGGRNVLSLAGGNQLIEGKVIQVNYKGKPYNIQITKVTSDSYTLSIGDVSVIRQLEPDTGGGVKFDR